MSLYCTLLANNELQVPANVSCACPGQVLTYTCNVVGGGITLWTGTAFSCSGSTNDISLRHTQFNSGASGSCNNDALMAKSIGVTNDCYTSQLNVTVSSTLNNKTIQCTHDSNMGSRIIGSSTLHVMTGKFEYSYSGSPEDVGCFTSLPQIS